jgi:hypothetical protein
MTLLLSAITVIAVVDVSNSKVQVAQHIVLGNSWNAYCRVKVSQLSRNSVSFNEVMTGFLLQLLLLLQTSLLV